MLNILDKFSMGVTISTSFRDVRR